MATTTVDVRVGSSTDDAEENTASGGIRRSSSDLEMTTDGSRDQLIGLRFAGLDIPPGAIIVNAYLRFTVDEVSTGAADLIITGQDADDALTFSSASNDLSSRTTTDASVGWNPPDWTTVGESDTAQQTPDISAIIQEIVDRDGWSAQGALSLMISGTGTRTAESYDGSAADAPLLHIEWTMPADGTPTLDLDGDDSAGILGADFAATFAADGAPVAIADADTTITDSDGTTIVSATITITNAQTDDVLAYGALPTGVNAVLAAGGSLLTFSGSATLAEYQALIETVTFQNTSGTPVAGDRLIQVVVSDGVNDSAIATSTVTVQGANTPPVATADSIDAVDGVARVIDAAELTGNDSDGDGDTLTIDSVGIPGNGSAVLNPNGTVTYTANAGFAGTDTFDYTVSDGNGGTDTATVTVTVSDSNAIQTVEARIATGSDDAEENLATGSVNRNSSDLELSEDGSTNQLIGMRFTGLDIPPDAVITNAYIQFTVDEVSTGEAALVIGGELSGNAQAYASTSNNISARADTTANVNWTPPDWTSTGESGADQRTPDISAIIQEIIGQNGWISGNAIGLSISGAGGRTAESFNGSAAAAPLLHVEYTLVPDGTPTVDLDGDDNSGMAGNDFVVAFTADGGPVAIADTDAVVHDSDTAMLVSARVQILDPQAGDTLGFGVMPLGIVATLEADGSVTLTGPATAADISAAIQSVTFDSPLATPVAGDRTIEVVVNDGQNDSVAATTTVTVSGANAPPEAADDAVSGAADAPLVIAASELLGNDIDGDGDTLIITDVTSPSNGAAVLNPDGSITYTPVIGFTGSDTFVYTVGDGNGGTDTATVTVDVGALGPSVALAYQVSASSDDAEERVSNGSVSLASSDIELSVDGSREQIVGVRFNGVDIPDNAVILNAYLQFTVDEASTGAASLEIHGEATDSAAAFSGTSGDISSRALTGASVSWTPPNWNSVGESGADQQTPDLSAIIQEIVNRTGWSAESSIALTITGSGRRTAESYDGETFAAPELHIEYALPSDGTPYIDLDSDNSSGALGNDFIAEFAEGGSPVTIADSDISIIDTDGTTLESATITLTNAAAGDFLAAGTTPGGINASVSGDGVTVTLTGTASLNEYETAIRTVTFGNNLSDPDVSDRLVDVTVNDGVNVSTGTTTTVKVGSQPFNFLVIADAPYRSSEFGVLNEVLGNLDPDVEFVIHLGDFLTGTPKPDPEVYFPQVQSTFLNSTAPLFIIMGDNEYNDMPDPDAAFTEWKDNFLYFDQNWTHDFGTQYQDVRQENFSFVIDQTLFIGINHVGSSAHDANEWQTRQVDNLNWITDRFDTFGSTVANTVIFGHADPGWSGYDTFEDGFRTAARDFEKPILWMQGDLHKWSLDPQPWSDVPNFTKIIVERTSEPENALLISASNDPDDPFDSDHNFDGLFL